MDYESHNFTLLVLVRTLHFDLKLYIRRPTFCRRHFQMHFLEWKPSYFKYNIISVSSLIHDWQIFIFCSNNRSVSKSNKPLPETPLIAATDVIWRHWSTLSYSRAKLNWCKWFLLHIGDDYAPNEYLDDICPPSTHNRRPIADPWWQDMGHICRHPILPPFAGCWLYTIPSLTRSCYILSIINTWIQMYMCIHICLE